MLAPRPLVGALLYATAPLAAAQSEVQGSLTVTQLGSSKAGYTTYQVSVDLGRTTADVYALFGEEGNPMIIPAGFQVPTPFGTDIGPTNEQFYAFNPDAQFDSFLTIGLDGPALQPGALSTVGIDFDAWNRGQEIYSDNGAVFFMDPEHGATSEPVVFCQLTVPQGTRFDGQISAQGKTVGRGEDWVATAMSFDQSGAKGRRPPPPPYVPGGSSGGGYGSDPPPPSRGDPSLVVIQVSSSKYGYETYQVGVTFDRRTTLDVYALYGEALSPLIIPPAFQVPAPFGADSSPVNPGFFAINPDVEFDSFLTIGIDGPATQPGTISTIGIDFGSWNERQGINTDNGAVFFMDPMHGATTEPVIFAQLTVPAGSRFTGQISAQGKSAGGGEDWSATQMGFSQAGATGGGSGSAFGGGH